MSIEKLDDGTGYKVRWRDAAGKSRRKKVTRWRDAIALDGEIKRKKAMGELIAHERGTITLNDFWEVWWTNHAIPNLTTKTRTTYEQLWATHMTPSLGSVKLSSLSRQGVTSWSAEVSTKLSPASVRQCLAILQGVMERAVEWDYITKNPVKGVRRPRLAQSIGRALTLTELQALISELPSLRDKAIVRVLTGSGIRPGELRALTWSDVRNDRISVTKAVSSNEIGPTKTNGLRAVSPTDDARRALLTWKMACGQPGGSDLVFPSAEGASRGDQLWTDLGWQMWRQRVFIPAARRAGLEGLRPYDLRHTYASQRIAEGADVLTLARSLGHSPTMTLTVYGHLLGGEPVPLECPSQADSA